MACETYELSDDCVCQGREPEAEISGIIFSGKKLLSKNDFSQKMYHKEVEVNKLPSGVTMGGNGGSRLRAPLDKGAAC